MEGRWDGRWGHTTGPMAQFFHGLKVRIGATLALLVGGFVGIILYLAFWAGRFTWYQNLAIIFSVILVVPLGVVLMWISWGVGLHRRMMGWADGPDRTD